MDDYYEYHESRAELAASEAWMSYPEECRENCEGLGVKGYCIIEREGTGFCPLWEEGDE